MINPDWKIMFRDTNNNTQYIPYRDFIQDWVDNIGLSNRTYLIKLKRVKLEDIMGGADAKFPPNPILLGVQVYAEDADEWFYCDGSSWKSMQNIEEINPSLSTTEFELAYVRGDSVTIPVSALDVKFGIIRLNGMVYGKYHAVGYISGIQVDALGNPDSVTITTIFNEPDGENLYSNDPLV